MRGHFTTYPSLQLAERLPHNDDDMVQTLAVSWLSEFLGWSLMHLLVILSLGLLLGLLDAFSAD